MADTAWMALQVQIQVLIDTWQHEKAERNDLADGMFTDGNKSYQQGYADALDRCVQALKLLQHALDSGVSSWQLLMRAGDGGGSG
jgi:hypothetical protein